MKIGVVGLGLIGGSIFKKLQSLNKYELTGVSRNVREYNITNDYNTLSNCDLIFICTPMSKTIGILEKLNTIIKPDTIVTDVCSLKEFVSKRNYSFKFIPSHPMAGTEHKGWDASFAELFQNATWAITPPEETRKEDLHILENTITELGARSLITTPKEHDKAVALISHAPMIVAQALCQTIKNNELAQQLASSGFRDTTRLALSNLEMANDMVQMNTENINAALNLLQNSLHNLLDENYLTNAKEIKNFRQTLYETKK